MASIFLYALSFLCFLLLFTPSFQTSSVTSRPLPSDSSDKVSLGLYYESLCPDSIDFITRNLPAIFGNGLISSVDIHFSPWGNAQILSNKTFDGQHGEEECLLNTFEACAIDVWPDVGTHFHFIYCAESNPSEWETCFDTLGLDRTPIDECYSSGYGNKLEIGYAKETAALKPPHRSVPWVVVNGEPLYDDYREFMSHICKAYKGSSRLSACHGIPVIRNSQARYTENLSRDGRLYTSKDDPSTEGVTIEDDASAKA